MRPCRNNAYKQKGEADKARADWAEAERLSPHNGK
jgi:hypothetical protein